MGEQQSLAELHQAAEFPSEQIPPLGHALIAYVQNQTTERAEPFNRVTPLYSAEQRLTQPIQLFETAADQSPPIQSLLPVSLITHQQPELIQPLVARKPFLLNQSRVAETHITSELTQTLPCLNMPELESAALSHQDQADLNSERSSVARLAARTFGLASQAELSVQNSHELNITAKHWIEQALISHTPEELFELPKTFTSVKMLQMSRLSEDIQVNFIYSLQILLLPRHVNLFTFV